MQDTPTPVRRDQYVLKLRDIAPLPPNKYALAQYRRNVRELQRKIKAPISPVILESNNPAP